MELENDLITRGKLADARIAAASACGFTRCVSASSLFKRLRYAAIEPDEAFADLTGAEREALMRLAFYGMCRLVRSGQLLIDPPYEPPRRG